jgi:hypothetical protein
MSLIVRQMMMMLEVECAYETGRESEREKHVEEKKM